MLIIVHITSVGIVGLKPQPTMITKINSNARFIYIVKKVFIPLLPPIIVSNTNNIRDSNFIII